MTATAAGGMHPTAMHSCCLLRSATIFCTPNKRKIAKSFE